MKAIYEKFTDEEYIDLLEAKIRSKKTWHDFILELANWKRQK